MQLNHLATPIVVRRAHDAARRCRADLVELLGCLAEIDVRRAYRELGYSSLWDYCLRALGFSESETSRRIRVARLARRVPVVMEALRAGRVHLTGLAMLAKVLTRENAEAVLAKASGLSKRGLEVLVIELSPESPSPVLQPDYTRIRPAGKRPARKAPPTKSSPSANSTDPKPREAPAPPAAPPTMEVVHRVTMTLTETVVQKLEKARDLLWHRVSHGDDNAIVERALDLLLATVEKERFGAPKPRKAQRRADKRTRHIQAAEKRKVYDRDAEGCEFVSSDGVRCGCRRIQLHHKHAYALGGANQADNLAKYCWTHNQLMAEIDFGPR